MSGRPAMPDATAGPAASAAALLLAVARAHPVVKPLAELLGATADGRRAGESVSGHLAPVAVALLMAIFQFRPSPFCILDEVDAPFDEANPDAIQYVFNNWTTANLGTMSLATAISIYYYLRIVKLMYMDEPAGAFLPMPNELRLVLGTRLAVCPAAPGGAAEARALHQQPAEQPIPTQEPPGR